LFNVVVLPVVQTVRGAGKIWPIVFRLSKVTRGHWNRHGSIGYIWLQVSEP